MEATLTPGGALGSRRAAAFADDGAVGRRDGHLLDDRGDRSRLPPLTLHSPWISAGVGARRTWARFDGDVMVTFGVPIGTLGMARLQNVCRSGSPEGSDWCDRRKTSRSEYTRAVAQLG